MLLRVGNHRTALFQCFWTGETSKDFYASVNSRTDLNELFKMLRERLENDFDHLTSFKPTYRDFRPGDVKHSQADIGKAREQLGYVPSHTIERRLDQALALYKQALS